MLLAFLVLLVLVLFLCVRERGRGHVRLGARKWNVVGGYRNAGDAAGLLDITHAKLITLMGRMKRKYHVDEDDDLIAREGALHTMAAKDRRHMMAEHLLRNYNPDSVFENDPRFESSTSYTTGKGRTLYLCLRQRENPDTLVDENTLMFTVLHELAHVANYDGWGHGPDFWKVFKWVLGEAVDAGIYDPVDYVKRPVMFCGLKIAYQPLFDARL